MKGNVKVIKNGEVVREVNNLVVTLGRNLNADIWRGRANVSGISPTNCWCAVGYSGTGTTAGMSGLVLEAPAGSIGRTNVTSVTRDPTGSTLTITTNFYDSGGLGPLQESALFSTGYATDEVTILPASDTTNSGCMICRATFSTLNNTSTDNLEVEWKITL